MHYILMSSYWNLISSTGFSWSWVWVYAVLFKLLSFLFHIMLFCFSIQFGETALHFAARKWNAEISKFLIDAGIDLNIREKVSWWPKIQMSTIAIAKTKYSALYVPVKLHKLSFSVVLMILFNICLWNVNVCAFLKVSI